MANDPQSEAERDRELRLAREDFETYGCSVTINTPQGIRRVPPDEWDDRQFEPFRNWKTWRYL